MSRVPTDVKAVCDVAASLGADAALIERFRGDLTAAPDNLEHWILFAGALRKANQPHAAMAVYDAAQARLGDQPRLWSNRGVLLREWARLDEALACFDRAIRLDSASVHALESRATTLERLCRFEEAVAAYQAVLRAEPKRPFSWNNMGNCLMFLGRKAEGKAALERAAALEPGFIDPLYNLALFAFEAGDFATALRFIDRVVALDPADRAAADLRKKILQKPAERAAAAPAPIKANNLVVRLDEPDREELRRLVHEAILQPGLTPPPDKPTIFLSYRWESPAQIAWVERLATDLLARGYDLVFDRFTAKETKSQTARDVIGRIVRCNLFVPVLTEGYRRRVELTDTHWGRVEEDGWVFDEWYAALQFKSHGRMKFLGVWRGGEAVPLPFTREMVADFRVDANYAARLAVAFPDRRRPGGIVPATTLMDIMRLPEPSAVALTVVGADSAVAYLTPDLGRVRDQTNRRYYLGLLSVVLSHADPDVSEELATEADMDHAEALELAQGVTPDAVPAGRPLDDLGWVILGTARMVNELRKGRGEPAYALAMRIAWPTTRRALLAGVYGSCKKSGDEALARKILEELSPAGGRKSV